MATATVPYGRVTQKPPAVKEVHILWITAGLGCDGDSVSITAATQPSVEDVILGAIPGLPKVHLHNPVLAYECGDDFMKFFYMAEKGQLEPFVLVVEGSIPNETIKKEGYWAAMGTNPNTGQFSDSNPNWGYYNNLYGTSTKFTNLWNTIGYLKSHGATVWVTRWAAGTTERFALDPEPGLDQEN